MIVTAVEAPGFSLDRLVAAAAERGVRTRMVTRDADVRSAEQDALAGEDLVVTLVNPGDLGPSRDPDSWARSALTAAIGLALDHQNPEARALIRNRAELRNHLYRHGYSRGRAACSGPAPRTRRSGGLSGSPPSSATQRASPTATAGWPGPPPTWTPSAARRPPGRCSATRSRPSRTSAGRLSTWKR
ncbi:hypothetical protein ACFQ9X_48280 [Catenulispora yoronensis]